MSFGEQMKRKADEVHLQEKAKDLGDAMAELMKAAVDAAAGYAAENRDKVDGVLDIAERKVGENISGKRAETVGKVRAQVDKTLDKLAEKGAKDQGAPADPPRAVWPTTPVPDDMHSSFDAADDPTATSADPPGDDAAAAGSPS